MISFVSFKVSKINEPLNLSWSIIRLEYHVIEIFGLNKKWSFDKINLETYLWVYNFVRIVFICFHLNKLNRRISTYYKKLNYFIFLFGGPLDFFKQQSCLFSIYIDSICQITITSISFTRLDYSYQTGNKISPSLHIILKIFLFLSCDEKAFICMKK